MSHAGNYDVVIIGGGVIGSSIAYFLTRDPTLRVAVVEPDPTYEYAATPRSVGGIRVQFSTRPNIQISQFAAEFIAQLPELLEVNGVKPDVSFQQNGYLLLANQNTETTLRENHALQRECGADISLLENSELSLRFPWMALDGISIGSIAESGEGWIDPYSLLQAFRRKAIAQGTVYLVDRVTDLHRTENQITSADLGKGGEIVAGTFVNAAGIHAQNIALMAGINDFPVVSRKRQVFAFDCRQNIPDMPLIIDPTGVYCRPEGSVFICGRCPTEENDPESTSFEVDHQQFENDIWPVLANRVPAFETIKVVNSWAGHYDVNTMDHNAILGPHPTLSNFYFANGFSGHGLQQSPAAGRAISEHILYRRYSTLDLSDFRYSRFAEGALCHERNIF